MSKNTSIKEGGTPFPFGPVKALLVEGSDGKYYPWVPESERQLGYKSIDKNGIYRASDDGVYGWSSVSVSVKGTSVTGRDPETGQDVTVTTDPETGELVETVVPTEIRVIEPPTNPYGIYVDGQTITKDGMVVKAYDANGNEMMNVPVGEITINPTQAVYDESKDEHGHGTATSEYDTEIPQPIPFRTFTMTFPITRSDGYTGTVTLECQEESARAVLIKYRTDTHERAVILLTAKQTASINITEITYKPNGDFNYREERFISTTANSIIENKIVYYNSDIANSLYCLFTSEGMPTDVAVQSINEYDAWTVQYGDISESPAGSPQTITVSWPRPGDGAILETTFDILVGPHGGTGDD